MVSNDRETVETPEDQVARQEREIEEAKRIIRRRCGNGSFIAT